MRKASKLFVLCMLAALSVMALSAAAAQAENEFLLNGETFAEAGVESKEIIGTVGEGELLTAGGIKIHCEVGSGVGHLYQGGTADAKVLFEGCTVLEAPQCFIYEKLEKDNDKATLTGLASIEASGNGRLLKHEGGHYALLDGLPKGVLGGGTKRLFSLFDIYGKFCPLNEGTQPLHVEVTGSTVVRVINALQSQLSHVIETINPETLKSLFPEDKMFFNSEEAHLSGGATATLSLVSDENWSSN